MVRGVLQSLSRYDRPSHRSNGEGMKVITLGPEGTFSHEMATLIGADEIVLVPTIGRVFAESGQDRNTRTGSA